MLVIRPASECRYDIVSLGEVMLRLDPGPGRIRTARRFDVWEGGGEYNVARGARKCFGLRAGVVTALVDNEVGRLIEDLMLAGGVDTSHVVWRDFDGIGRGVRNGLNFTERGFGVRGAIGASDRGHTAAASFAPGEIDWDAICSQTRWLHTGGIFAALSESSAEVVVEALTAAKRHGVVVSYDLNYRPSLWRAIGGQDAAREINRHIASYVDVMIGNEEDFTACLGLAVPGADERLSDLPTEGFAAMMQQAANEFGNFQVIATTLRSVLTATINDWSALAWSRETGVVQAAQRRLEIFDRVGGGDSFASGLICGLLDGETLVHSLELGAAHGALAMTTPGDTSMATRAEVTNLANGGSARVDR